MKDSLGKSAYRKLIIGCCLIVGAVTAHSQTRPLNDTGVDFCAETFSGNNKPCLGTEPSGQDSHYGRDAQAAAGKLTKIGGGNAGFDFTALDASGNPTTPSSGSNLHPCVRDNVTGLVWEVKTDDGGLHDQNWTYTWYNTNSPDGNPGTAGSGTCYQSGRCDTEKFVQDVNAAGWCGYTSWRMPTVKELEGIADLGRIIPAIDPTWFPNTPVSQLGSHSIFWSGSSAISPGKVWYVNFREGGATHEYTYYDFHVRLVRDGQ